jgi:hypothetical protein
MKFIIQPDIFLPITFLVIQALILLFLIISVLRKLQILKSPIEGMEYGSLILCAGFVFGVLLISTADSSAIFEAYKAYKAAGVPIFSNLFSKFGQYFIVEFFFFGLFMFLSLFIIKPLLGLKKPFKEIQEGNMAAAILSAVIIVSISIVLLVSTKEVLELIIPRYINYR